MQRLKLGKFEVYSLEDAAFRLDGGAMFGVVPKVIWQKKTQADDLNRIPLTIRPLLIKGERGWYLVETGMDDKQGERHRSIYAINGAGRVLAQLAELGLKTSDIKVVINTHLHFDHAGLNTTSQDGHIVPLFTNASYLVQKQELEDALHPHERNRASYLPENIEPIAEGGLFEAVEGEVELEPGLKLVPLPGHTLGQQGVLLESEGKTLVYTADLLPTLAHAPLAYIMSYDLYPVTTLQTRKRMYEQWVAQEALIATPHDPNYAFARLVKNDKGYRAEPLD